jgi:hypothetical protein
VEFRDPSVGVGDVGSDPVPRNRRPESLPPITSRLQDGAPGQLFPNSVQHNEELLAHRPRTKAHISGTVGSLGKNVE